MISNLIKEFPHGVSYRSVLIGSAGHRSVYFVVFVEPVCLTWATFLGGYWIILF